MGNLHSEHVGSGDSRDPVALAVVGSTEFRKDGEATEKAVHLICAALDDLDPLVVISGGASGIDKLAVGLARERGIPTVEHHPANRRWEPDGFKARNLLIAEDCTHLLCIRHSKSTTYGSGWTADQAERLGKVVTRHVI